MELLLKKKVVVSILIGTLFIGFFYKKKIYEKNERKIKSLTTEKTELERKLNEYRKKKESLERVKAELDSLSRIWEFVHSLLPEKQDAADLIDDIRSACLSSGVKLMFFRPREKIPHSRYWEFPADVKVRGGFHEFATFLSFLVNGDRIVHIREIEINRLKEKKDSRETIEATFKLSTFTYAKELEKKSKSQKKRKKSRKRRRRKE